MEVNSQSGKRALITGAGSGIGRAIAQRLAEEGYSLFLTDVNEAGLKETAGLIPTSVRVQCEVVDVSNREQVNNYFARTFSVDQPLHYLVNNAGASDLASILDVKIENFDKVMNVNLRGALHHSLCAAPMMVSNGFGKIVNVASMLGKRARPSTLAYSTSKFAVLGLTQSMALDLAKHNINVNAVCPGAVSNTTMRDEDDIKGIEFGLLPANERAKQIPLQRLAEPLDVANVVAFLLSPSADYITGEFLSVSGGI